MARLTVEDCLEHVDNRFDLVLLAAKRARQIAMGMEPLIPENRDKPTVVALREIAEGLVSEDNIDPPTPEEFLDELLVDGPSDDGETKAADASATAEGAEATETKATDASSDTAGDVEADKKSAE